MEQYKKVHFDIIFPVAVDKLPNFLVRPSKETGEPSDHHRCTIHVNVESLSKIEEAYVDCLQGKTSDR